MKHKESQVSRNWMASLLEGSLSPELTIKVLAAALADGSFRVGQNESMNPASLYSSIAPVTEDTALTASGQLIATDVDHGATQTWSVQGNATGTYGSIEVDSDCRVQQGDATLSGAAQTGAPAWLPRVLPGTVRYAGRIHEHPVELPAE